MYSIWNDDPSEPGDKFEWLILAS